jgi:hypothetical protein
VITRFDTSFTEAARASTTRARTAERLKHGGRSSDTKGAASYLVGAGGVLDNSQTSAHPCPLGNVWEARASDVRDNHEGET